MMKRYLVCYDIADPKRLVRVNKVCKRYGIPMQYSVFLLRGDKRKIDDLVEDLVGVINEREDDVRIYPLKNEDDGVQLGSSGMPEDAWVHTGDEGFDMLLLGKEQDETE